MVTTGVSQCYIERTGGRGGGGGGGVEGATIFGYLLSVKH